MSQKKNHRNFIAINVVNKTSFVYMYSINEKKKVVEIFINAIENVDKTSNKSKNSQKSLSILTSLTDSVFITLYGSS